MSDTEWDTPPTAEEMAAAVAIVRMACNDMVRESFAQLLSPTVQVKRLYPDALIPAYQSGGDSGMDLHAYIKGRGTSSGVAVSIPPGFEARKTIQPGETVLVGSGVAVSIPPGFEGQVRSRSGLALKQGLMVLNSPGTIDAPFRGECGVILHNTSSEPRVINHGDRIAQLVIAPVAKATKVEVESLDETNRGSAGFGSSGV